MPHNLFNLSNFGRHIGSLTLIHNGIMNVLMHVLLYKYVGKMPRKKKKEWLSHWVCALYFNNYCQITFHKGYTMYIPISNVYLYICCDLFGGVFFFMLSFKSIYILRKFSCCMNCKLIIFFQITLFFDIMKFSSKTLKMCMH